MSRLGETGPLKGSVTLCRGVANGTWRVDTASFEATPPPVAAVPKAGASKARAAQAKRTSPVAPATTIIIVEQPVAVVRTAPADSGNGVRPMPVITEPTGRFPTAGTGMETLGDALEDRSPHVPAN